MLDGERAVGESQRGRRRSTMFGVKIHINMVETGGGGSECSEYTAGGRGGSSCRACRAFGAVAPRDPNNTEDTSVYSGDYTRERGWRAGEAWGEGRSMSTDGVTCSRARIRKNGLGAERASEPPIDGDFVGSEVRSGERGRGRCRSWYRDQGGHVSPWLCRCSSRGPPSWFPVRRTLL